jgi:hypothetical protein
MRRSGFSAPRPCHMHIASRIRPDVLAMVLKRDGLIDMHDSGAFFRFTEKVAQRFAWIDRKACGPPNTSQPSSAQLRNEVPISSAT